MWFQWNGEAWVLNQLANEVVVWSCFMFL
jgi:hypothetical protein